MMSKGGGKTWGLGQPTRNTDMPLLSFQTHATLLKQFMLVIVSINMTRNKEVSENTTQQTWSWLPNSGILYYFPFCSKFWFSISFLGRQIVLLNGVLNTADRDIIDWLILLHSSMIISTLYKFLLDEEHGII